MTNCPNCGAVITSSQCEYCGTIFELDKRFSDKFIVKIGGKITQKKIKKLEEQLNKALLEDNLILLNRGLITINELRKEIKQEEIKQ